VEPIKFTCPTCKLLLSYQPHEAGEPYQCPQCGDRGVLPPAPDQGPPRPPGALPVFDRPPAPIAPLRAGSPDFEVIEDEPPRVRSALPPLQERALVRQAPTSWRKYVRGWHRVRLGLQIILLAWLAMCLLSALLVLGVFFRCAQFLAGSEEPLTEGSAFVGGLGLLVVLAESAALWGYWCCLEVPRQGTLRAWAWAVFGTAVARNFACATASILFVANPGEGAKAVAFIVAVALFFSQWLVCTLWLRALADHLREYWLLRMVWNDIFLGVFTALGWALLLCVVFVFFLAAGDQGVPELQDMGVRAFFGVGGMLFSILVVLSFLWHARVLYSVEIMIEPMQAARLHDA
jgi:hypothetical protein